MSNNIQERAERLIGILDEDLDVIASSLNLDIRIVNVNGTPRIVTRDYKPGRVNVEIYNSIVIGVNVE